MATSSGSILRWPDPLVMTDNGSAVFSGYGPDMPGAVDDKAFFDVATHREVPRLAPHFSAGGSEQVAVRVRRGSVIVGQSRVLVGAYAVRATDPTDGSHPGFTVSSCFAMDGGGAAQLFSIDVDAELRTALVGEVDCQRPAPRVPVIEAFDFEGKKPARVFPIDGKPIAIDLSASGDRAIVTVEKGATRVDELWDVQGGKRVANVSLDASCFEISPNGSSVAKVVGGVLTIQPLP